jgi:phage baseplate assembly protein W
MPTPTKNRTYQGYSTVVGDGLTTLYDATLVNQDLYNNFMTRKGEVITDPSYGSIAWDMLFEPASEENLNIIKQDCMTIFNNESRVQVQSITVVASEDPSNTGFTLQAVLNYVGLSVSQQFTVNFFSNLTNNDPGT